MVWGCVAIEGTTLKLPLEVQGHFRGWAPAPAVFTVKLVLTSKVWEPSHDKLMSLEEGKERW